MSDPRSSRRSPRDVVESLHAAANAHDLDAIVGHFSPEYVLENPCHPDRSFRGRDQVRRNWSRILAGAPDLTVTTSATLAAGLEVWCEIEMRGHRPDGAEHHMRGVMIFRVAEDLIIAGRFYLEPVLRDGLDADGAVRAAMSGSPR